MECSGIAFGYTQVGNNEKKKTMELKILV